MLLEVEQKQTVWQSLVLHMYIILQKAYVAFGAFCVGLKEGSSTLSKDYELYIKHRSSNNSKQHEGMTAKM